MLTHVSIQVEITTDECFGNDSKIIVEQLTKPYLTHTIGRILEAGTVCTFDVAMFNSSDIQLDTVSASCTVHGTVCRVFILEFINKPLFHIYKKLHVHMSHTHIHTLKH